MNKKEFLKLLAKLDSLPDDTSVVLCTTNNLQEVLGVRVTEVAFCGDKLEFPDEADYGTTVILID